MWGFSESSKEALNTAVLPLRELFNKVIEIHDCKVLEGYRIEEKQNRYFDEGRSKVRFPYGKHNKLPSEAVDVVPFVNNEMTWDVRHCIYFAGVVMATAHYLGINIRWGGNWDMDEEIMTDQDFQDLVHFEYVGG